MLMFLLGALAPTVLLICLLVMRIKPKHVDGYVLVLEDGPKKIFSLELVKTPDEIAEMKYITFKVADRTTNDLE
jgi:hypothetical protein